MSMLLAGFMLAEQTGGGGGDPDFASVVSLLHLNGTDGSTTFTDVIGKTWTATGNAQIDTAQSKFGGASLLLDGSGDYISSADQADYELGANNFTFECFVRFNAFPANNGGQFQMSIYSKDVNGSRGFSINAQGTSTSIDNIIFLGFSTNSTFTSVTAPFSFSLNTWYFITVCRSGNLIYISVDGTILNPGGTAFSRTIQNTTTPIKIGANVFDATFSYYFNGWIDESRITKGVARYTSDFTVPSSEFPDF